jgi:hypothetical protein
MTYEETKIPFVIVIIGVGPALGHGDAEEPCFKKSMNNLNPARKQRYAYMVDIKTPKDIQIL